MADNDIQITIGADSSSLQAQIRIAQAELASLNTEAKTLAAQMVATGATADASLVNALTLIEKEAAATKTQITALTASTEAVAVSTEAVGHAAATTAPTLTYMTRELRALADEAAAGRWRNFDGTLVNIAGRSMGMIAAFVAANPVLSAFGAAVAVAAGTATYFAFEFAHAAAVVTQFKDALALSASVPMDKTSIDQYSASIRNLGGVSTDQAKNIVASFGLMQNGSKEVIGAIISDIAALQTATGEDAEKIATSLQKIFSDPLNGLSKLEAAYGGVTAAQRKEFEAAAQSGNIVQTQSALQDIIAQKVAAVNKSKIDDIQNEINAKQALIKKNEAIGDQSVAYNANVSDYIALLEKQKQKLEESSAAALGFSNAIGTATTNMAGLAKQFDEVLKATTPEADAIKKASENIAILSRGLSYGGSDASSEQAKNLNAALASQQDILQKNNDILAGGNAQQKAALATVEATVAGHNDQVAAAQRVLDADIQQSSVTHGLLAQNELLKKIEEDKLTLKAKQTEAGLATLQVAQAEASGTQNYEKEYQAALKIAAFKKAAAGDDVQLNAEADAEKIAAENNYYSHVTSEEGKKLEFEMDSAHQSAAAREKALDEALQTKKIKESAWLSQTLQTLDFERVAVTELYAKEIENAGEATEKILEIKRQEQKALAEIAAKEWAATEKAAKDSEKSWDSSMKVINGAFDSQVDGLITGTKTWGTAFRGALTSLTEDTAKFFLNWGLKQAENVAKSIILGNTQVEAHIAGTAAMTAADQTAGATSLITMIANAIKAITTAAGQTFAGVFAFLSPELGPAAAGPAAASSAAVMAAASFDIGAWNLPSDQLAMVHKGELIMPAAESEAFRSMLSGASKGETPTNVSGPVTHHHSWNINGNTNPREVAREVARQWNTNPSLRPAY